MTTNLERARKWFADPHADYKVRELAEFLDEAEARGAAKKLEECERICQEEIALGIIGASRILRAIRARGKKAAPPEVPAKPRAAPVHGPYCIRSDGDWICGTGCPQNGVVR
jgi:hypothetical protein